jgi:ribonuclease HI
MKADQAVIYSDGACSGNPGPGGWGAIVAFGERVKELGGGSRVTTNNKMEMTAVLEALRYAANLPQAPKEILCYTDSTYLIRGITQWAWGWRKNGWKTSSGDEVLNRDIWEEMTAILGKLKGSKVSWLYVRGHMGTPGNERCDEIAVAFSRAQSPRLYDGAITNYFFDIQEPPPVEDLPAIKNYEKRSAYSYLSLVGGHLRRHKDWPSCERRVKGQSGARFKKAMDPLQEKEILASWGFDPEIPVLEE